MNDEDTFIILRTSRRGRRKSSDVRAANRSNLTLAAWCFRELDRVSGHVEATEAATGGPAIGGAAAVGVGGAGGAGGSARGDVARAADVAGAVAQDRAGGDRADGERLKD